VPGTPTSGGKSRSCCGPTTGLTRCWVFAALAVTVGPLGLLWPQTVRWVYVAWMVLAFPIGWTISTVILALMFFLVFTPVALVFRLKGRDALGLKPKPDAATYWVDKPVITDPRRYLYQS
jgi:hypothetical protein